ncbi:hypothetical protein CHS0354_033810, partial [Potamilus streckersoni]
EEVTQLLPKDGTKTETHIEVNEEVTQLLPKDGTKTETHIEVNADQTAKKKTKNISRKRLKFPCQVEKCNQKYSSKKGLSMHILEHHPGFLTAANLDINTDLSSVNIDTSSGYALPSQSKVSSIQSASISVEDKPLLPIDGSQIETVAEVHESAEKYRDGSHYRKIENFHCPTKQCQQKYSERESLLQHISEHHSGLLTVYKDADSDIYTQLTTSRLYVHLGKQSTTYHCVKDESENENTSNERLGQRSDMNLLAPVSEDLDTHHDFIKCSNQEDLDASSHFTSSSLSSQTAVNFSKSVICF